MKQISLFVISLLVLIACAPVQNSDSQINNGSEMASQISSHDEQLKGPDLQLDYSKCAPDLREDSECYFQNAKAAKNFNFCKISSNAELEEACLNRYAYQMTYYDDWPISLEVCHSMADPNHCYELVALKQKSPETCDMTTEPENCKDMIHKITKNADWELIQHWTDTFDARIVYKGKATLQGWMLNTSNYNSEPTSHFRVSELSLNDLPLADYNDFILTNIDSSTKEKLHSHNEENPVTIIVNELEAFSEGSPHLNPIGIID